MVGNPPGTVSLGQVLKASRESAIAAKPECKKEITKALREQYKGVDRKQRLRGVQNANDLSTDATNALGTSPSNTNIGF